VRRYALRFVALFYLFAILIAPLGIVFYRTFEDGFRPAWEALSAPDTIHAFKLTLIITAIAVPLNTIFGIICALAIVRKRFPGKGLLNAFIDLPSASRCSSSTGVRAGSAASSSATTSRCSSRCRR
jgi:sulfate transport system permease protein